MKFTAKEDIGAPIEAVFAALTDFDSFEKMGLRRGVQARRTDPWGGTGVGTSWLLDFSYRGKPRQIQAELTSFTRPTGMVSNSDSRVGSGRMEVRLLELAPNRTRVQVDLEVTPRTLPAKLLVQSLRLARGRVNDRYETRVGLFLRDIEARLVRA